MKNNSLLCFSQKGIIPQTFKLGEMEAYVFYSVFSGKWWAYNGKGKRRCFPTQLEAENFAGVEYESEKNVPQLNLVRFFNHKN